MMIRRFYVGNWSSEEKQSDNGQNGTFSEKAKAEVTNLAITKINNAYQSIFQKLGIMDLTRECEHVPNCISAIAVI